MSAISADFISPLHSSYVNILGPVTVPVPVDSNDIACKIYVDSTVANQNESGKIAVSMTGSASDPIVFNISYFKIGNMVTLEMNESDVIILGNNAVLEGTHDMPASIKPTASFPYLKAVLRKYGFINVVYILFHGTNSVTMTRNSPTGVWPLKPQGYYTSQDDMQCFSVSYHL